MRLATAIMMYSFGGIQREQGGETLPPGVTEKELMEACLVPGLDSITAQSVLKRLRDECLFLHYDGTRYCFKTQANVNKILEDEADNVRADEVRKYIQQAIEERVGAATNAAVIWPRERAKRYIGIGRPRSVVTCILPYSGISGEKICARSRRD
jgi:hypothetical protein